MWAFACEWRGWERQPSATRILRVRWFPRSISHCRCQQGVLASSERVLGADRLHQLFNSIAISPGDKGRVIEALSVHGLERGKVLPDEPQVDLLRAGLEKERLGAEKTGAGVLGSLRHPIQRLA